MLTPEQIKTYAEDPDPKCPYCGTVGNMSGVFTEISADGAFQRITCTVCGKGWFDLFQLIGIQEDDE